MHANTGINENRILLLSSMGKVKLCIEFKEDKCAHVYA